MKVLFVCLGNICRSPTADAIFRAKVEAAGLADKISVDSAGTGDWHIGKAPDSRAQAAAAQRGYDLSNLRARQVQASDFQQFDYILGMDESNLINMRDFMPAAPSTLPELFLQRYGNDSQYTEVPDPFYGNEEGFELVLDLIEAASDNLLTEISRKLTQ